MRAKRAGPDRGQFAVVQVEPGQCRALELAKQPRTLGAEGELFDPSDLLRERDRRTVLSPDDAQHTAPECLTIEVGDPVAIRRPGWLDVESRSVGQSRHRAASPWHSPDRPLVREGDPVARRGKSWVDRAKGPRLRRMGRRSPRRRGLRVDPDPPAREDRDGDDPQAEESLRDDRHGSPRSRLAALISGRTAHARLRVSRSAGMSPSLGSAPVLCLHRRSSRGAENRPTLESSILPFGKQRRSAS